MCRRQRRRIFDGFFESEDFEDMLESIYSAIKGLAWWYAPFESSFCKFEHRECAEHSSSEDPFTDIIMNHKKGEVIIAVELPGVRKKDIKIDVTESEISIEVGRGEERYHKNIPLDVNIRPETAKAKFNNRVLEIIARVKKGRMGIKVE